MKGMEELLKKIGKCSSTDTNKFDQFGIECCRPGWTPLSEAEQTMLNRCVSRSAPDDDGQPTIQTCPPNLPTVAVVSSTAGSSSVTSDSPHGITPAQSITFAQSSNQCDPSVVPWERDLEPCASEEFQPSDSHGTAQVNKDIPAQGQRRSAHKKQKVCDATDSMQSGVVAISDCVAHLVCIVDRVLDDSDGHLQLKCRVTSAHVRKGYWTGNTFKPTAADLPPYLTFFGGGEFGVAQPL